MTDKISRQRKQNENLKQKQKQLKHILFSTIAEIKKREKAPTVLSLSSAKSFVFCFLFGSYAILAYRLHSLRVAANVSL